MTQVEQTKTTQQKKQKPANFKPLGNRVLLQRLEHDENVKGVIIIPDSAKKKQEQAEVVAVGPGKKDKAGNIVPMPVKVGDIVLIEKYSGQEVTLNEGEYVIVRADDLLAIVEK